MTHDGMLVDPDGDDERAARKAAIERGKDQHYAALARGDIKADPWWKPWVGIVFWLGFVGGGLFLMGVIVAGVTHRG